MAQVFQLNDTDNDFLNFEYTAPVATGKGKAKTKKEPLPLLPKTRASTSRKKSEPINYYDAYDNNNEYQDTQSRPLAPVFDDEMPSGVVTKEKSRKIPLKSVQEHQLLMNQLNGYSASLRFKPVLDQCGITLKDLGKKSVAELKELRERVRACCANSSGNVSVVHRMTLGVCSGIEAVAPKAKLDLSGFSEAVQANPEFEALCEMIELDSGFKASLTPIQRMAILLGGTAFDVGCRNKSESMKAVASTASRNLVESLKAQRSQLESRIAQDTPNTTAQPAPSVPQSGSDPYLRGGY